MLTPRPILSRFLVSGFAILSLALLAPQPAIGKMMSDSIVIFEVSVGAGAVADEYMTLYNPTPDSKGLTAYRMTRATATMATMSVITSRIDSTVADTIGPFGFYRLVSVGANAVLRGTADSVSSTATLAADNQIMLGQATSNTNYTDSRDRLGWGAVTTRKFTETQAVTDTTPGNPPAGKALYRFPGKIAGGMIDRQRNGFDFDTALVTDTFNTGTRHRRVVFSCTTPTKAVRVGLAFNLYCTATVVYGDTYWIQDTNVVASYSGDSAWADLTGWGKDTLVVDSSGDTADTTGIFRNGLCTMTLRFTPFARIADTVRIVASDAYCTGFIILRVFDSPTADLPAIGHETNVIDFLVRWTMSDSSGFDSYEIEVSKSVGFSSIAFADTIDITQTSDTITGLYNDTYYWRVRFIDNFGVRGNWSETRSFVTDTLIGAPTASYPADAHETTSSSVVVGWTQVSSDSVGIDSYAVEASTNAGFTAMVLTDTVDGTRDNDTVTAATEATYSWRVRAIDDLGNGGSYSTTRTFVRTSASASPTPSVKVDGDSSDWVGTRSSTVHDTVISLGEWIYSGDPNDVRGEGTDPDENYDITEARLSGDTLHLFMLVVMEGISSNTLPFVGLSVDVDQVSYGMDWALADDGMANGYPSSDRYSETNVSFHRVSGSDTIEMFEASGSWGGNWWHSPVATPRAADSISISTTNEVVEAALRWEDLSVTLPKRLKFVLASAENDGTSCDNDGTVDRADADILDVVTPYYSGSASSWTRDIIDDEYDYSFVVNFNKNGKVNHPPDTPTLSSPADGTIYTSATTVTMSWTLNDATADVSKDSMVHIQIGTNSDSNDVLDTKIHGADLDLDFRFWMEDTYYWRIRHADDFNTSPWTKSRQFGIQLSATTGFAVDGDTSEWTGTPSSTAHDTAISNGEFIYTGVAYDMRTDPDIWTDSNYDITQVRFSGDTNHLYLMVAISVLSDRRAPHIAFNVDLDQLSGDGSLDWIGPDDGATLAGTTQYGETNVSLHVAGRGTSYDSATYPEIEMFAQDWTSWHSPSAGSYDSVAISNANNVIEAGFRWPDIIGGGGTLPKKIRIALASYSNNTSWNSNSAATHDVTGSADAMDNIRPYAGTTCAACPASWDWDLVDADYDTSVTIEFNRTGRVNHIPGQPSVYSPANGSSFSEADNLITLQWSINDADSWTALDSAVFVQVTNRRGILILDTELVGPDADLVYRFPAGDSFYWRVRHSDDFETSPWSDSGYFSVSDTIDIKTPVDATGGTQETTNATVTLTGYAGSSDTTSDTVQVTVNGAETTVMFLSSAGVWSCSATLADRAGESVIIRLFNNGVQTANDTINLFYDATKPRITKISDSSLRDASSASVSDTVFFYIFDTGVGFGGDGGCTLYWHIDSGANTNWSVATESSSSPSGTTTIEAMIPVSTFNPLVDTQVGFWWICRDDLGNLMDSTSLSPSYLDVRPGTFTVEVVGVRDIVINEIMWGGSGGEYIELRNMTGVAIRLTNWVLKDLASDPTSMFAFQSADSIPAYGFFLALDSGAIDDTSSHATRFPRTNSALTLTNTGDSISLVSDGGLDIDSAWFNGGWPAGSATGDGTSMERKPSPGYGNASSDWDDCTTTLYPGTGGRTTGTPGHRNTNVDSVTFSVVSSGGTYETNATGITLTGFCSLQSGDSVWIFISNTAAESTVLTSGGVWSVSGIDLSGTKRGESIAIYTFDDSVYARSDTITIVYDAVVSQVSLSAPATGHETTSISVVLSWSAVSDTVDIDSYALEVSKNTDFTNMVFTDTLDGTRTNDTSTGLYNDTYYWRVRAIDDLGNGGPYSDTRGFVTDTIVGAPTLSQPSDGHETTSISVVVSWSLSDSVGIDSFAVEASKNTAFTNIAFTDTIDGSRTNDTVTGLYNDTYYWRVRAIDDLGNRGPYSDTRGFVTDTLVGTPAASYPAEAHETTVTSVVVGWSAVSSDSVGIDSYAVEVSRNGAFTEMALTDTIDGTRTNDTVSASTPATYSWRVRAIDDLGNSGAYSSTATFVRTVTQSITIDGDSNDWPGTPSTTAHDTVISSGVFIYTGVAGDERTEVNDWSDLNYDITQVRFFGDTNFFYVLVVMQDITDSRGPYVGLGIDKDSATSDGDLNWIADEDGLTVAGANHDPESSVRLSVAGRSNGSAPEIEITDEAAGLGSWQAPTNSGGHAATAYESVAISVSNNVIEAALQWKDLSVTLPARLNLTLAAYSNTTPADWANNNDATADNGAIDGADVMTPYCTNGDNAWGRDLSDADFDSFVTVGFNKTGQVNYRPFVPTQDTPGNLYVFTESNNSITLQWQISDADSNVAKDSMAQIQVTTGTGRTVLDTKIQGWDPDLVYRFLSGDSYYWRVRYADDFETTTWTDSLVFRVSDTIDIKTPVDATGGTHETTTQVVVLTGYAGSGDTTTDTVQVTVNGAETTVMFLSSAGVWSCSATLRDLAGESVIVRLFNNGIQTANDTINLFYDATPPRITRIGDTSVRNDSTVRGSSDTIFFYVFDTGVGFGSAGGCTLYWHADTGTNINWVVASESSSSPSGTTTIEAMIPAATWSPSVDTDIGFWWVCRDDLGNTMDSTSLSPSYIESRPGTYTVDVLTVGDVVINEIMWGGRSGSGEYIELRNASSLAVSLTNWVLRDKGGGSSGFSITFQSADSIPAGGFFLVMDSGAIDDTSSHYVRFPPKTGGIALTDGGDSIELLTDVGAEMDSAVFTSGWPAGSATGDGKSMDRTPTPGYGNTSTNWENGWDSAADGGRANGSPGHRNPNASPYVTVSPDSTPAATGGRGVWTFTFTNGQTAFTSGRLVMQIDTGGSTDQTNNWTQPQTSTSSSPGYVTTSVSNGTLGTVTTSGDSVIIDVTSLTATTGQITITYGSVTANTGGAAKVRTTTGRAYFRFYYDEDSTVTAPVRDTAEVTIPIVSLSGGSFADTDPASNPQSFIGSEYAVTIKVKDSNNNAVHAAHVWATLPADGADSQLSEYSSFGGAYDTTGNGVTRIGGYTNGSGNFQFNLKVSATVGLNQVKIDDTDVSSLGPTTYSDSARLPSLVISEIMWAGGGEYIELYNPTHETQSLNNFGIWTQAATDDANRIQSVDTATMGKVGYLNPFSYALIAGAADLAQDSGFSPVNTGPIDVPTLADAGESFWLVNAQGGTLDRIYKTTTGFFAGSSNPAGDTSMERVNPSRGGGISSSWDASDSVLNTSDGGGGGGSPGRPNAKSLYSTEVDRLDSFIGRANGSTMDTARVTLILKIANGDTQPNQEIGLSAVVSLGPQNQDSTWYLSYPSTTNSAGTAAITVSANGNNTSGTVHIRLRQPYGATDSAFIVFDRGDSMAYVFTSSETNVWDTSATNAMLVYVAFYDSFSGIDTAIMPKLQWKIGAAGTFSTMTNMTNVSGETHLARIDISTDTWSKIAHDSIYWRVTWRDKAGNYDTSPDNNAATAEYIDNTKARDTLTYPTTTDTLSGTSANVKFKLVDAANDACTVILKYDSYSNGNWQTITMNSGYNQLSSIRSTPDGLLYDTLQWNTITDLPETRVYSIRLRIEVFDGYDTYTETSSTFTVDNLPPDTAQIVIPVAMGNLENTTTVQIRWRFTSSVADDTQGSWLMEIDTGPNPDWAQLADSQSRGNSRNETYTAPLAGGQRYHVRIRTWGKYGVAGPYSSDTWFWVPRRVMDGQMNDWQQDTSGADTDAGFVAGGEFIWMDRIGDRRNDAAVDDDYDLHEFRVISDSYFYYFLFRNVSMTTTSILYSISIDSDRSGADTDLNWFGDESNGGGSTSMGRGGEQYGEFNFDYALAGADSPIWFYTDTTGTWRKENYYSREYMSGTNKIAEMAIPKMALRPRMVGDTMRLTIATAENNSGDPNLVDRTVDYSPDHLDDIYPGFAGGSAWDDLSDGDIDFYVDIFFRDTGDVRSNASPTGSMAALAPADNSETYVQGVAFRWAPAADADAADTVTYWFRFDDDSGFGGIVDSQAVLVRGAESVTLAGAMDANKTYYWQVRARDNHGQYGQWSDTYEFTTRAYPDTPMIISAALGGTFENTTTVRVIWQYRSTVFTADTQSGYEVQIDTGPNPDWSNLADSKSGMGTLTETRTAALAQGHRYHVRVRTVNDSGYSPYSEADSWFWVPRRIMDGQTGDWIGTAGTDTDAGSVSAGEFIWMDRVDDRRTDPGTPDDFDLTEFRVTSDSYFYFFLFRMGSMSLSGEPLFSIAIDSDRKSGDTDLNWIGDQSAGGASMGLGWGADQYSEINIDYTAAGSDSPIYIYTDTGGTWVNENKWAYEYLRTTTQAGELAIPKMSIKPLAGSDTLRITVGIAGNNAGDPNSVNRTDDWPTTDYLDNIFPGSGNSAWTDDLSDADIDFFLDIFFVDTGDVRSNNAPSGGLAAVAPADLGNTYTTRPLLQWTRATDADAEDTVTYWVRLDDDSSFGSENFEILLLRGTDTCLASGLTDSKTYYWQVRARDNHGQYSAWSDTFEFLYRRPGYNADGDTSEWTGTRPTTDNDTVVSNNEFIYRGAANVRTDPNDWPDSNYDITEVRFTGDTNNLYVMVAMVDITDTMAPHVAFNIDKDQSSSDANLIWLGPDDNGAIDSAPHYGETNVSLHGNTNDGGEPRIEMFAEDWTSWHSPSAGSADSVVMSTTNNVVEAAFRWPDLIGGGASLPMRLRITLASYSNVKNMNSSGNATTDIGGSIDATDVLMPDHPNNNNWTGELDDADYDTFVTIDFNKYGRINLFPDAPTPDTPTGGAGYASSNNAVTLQWIVNDADSVYGRDSSVHVEVYRSALDTRVVDRRLNGDSYNFTYTFQKGGTYFWRVRYADDFGTSAFSAFQKLQILDTSTVVVDGDSTDWRGTPSTTSHDTVISDGVFIYTGVADDERTDATDPDKNYDLTQVRFTGDTYQLYGLFVLQDISDTREPHLAFNVDKDQTAASGLTWLAPDDDGSLTNSSARGETNVSLHAAAGAFQIELFDVGGSWHNPPANNSFRDSVAIDSTTNVVEVSMAWTDMSVTLPAKLRFSVAALANVAGNANSSNNATEGIFEIDALDDMRPFTGLTGSPASWDWDLENENYDSFVTLGFNKNGRVNHRPSPPTVSAPAANTIFTPAQRFVAFQFTLSDADSWSAKDSAVRLKVINRSNSTVVDSSFYGLTDSVTIGFATNDTYHWQVRHADDFETSSYTDSITFGVLNTRPYDTILVPPDGDTVGGQVTIQFLAIDADSDRCTAAIEYSPDTGVTWYPATLTGTSVINNLYTPSEGDTKTVVWLSKTDQPDTQYTYLRIRVILWDGTDTGKADTTLNVGLDNVKPAGVDTLTAAADVDGSDTGVYLLWSTSPSADSKGYNLYRSSTTDSRPSTKVNVGVITDTFGFKDSSAVQGDTQHYYVTTVDSVGNESDSSELEAAPNLEVVKSVSTDSSNPTGRPRPGDTVVFTITVRNNGYAPAEGVVLYDYVPSNTAFTDSSTATSVQSSWTIHYRVGEDVWQTPMTDTATMVRFTRSNRFDPSKATPSDTVTLKVKIK